MTAARLQPPISPPSPDEALKSVDRFIEILRLIWVVNHALRRRVQTVDPRQQLNDAQRLTLWLIGSLPGINPGRVAQILRIHPSSSTRMLRDFERLGAVQRSIDPADARCVTFRLTPYGRKLCASPRDQAEALAHAVLDRLPGRKIQAASEVLAALSLALVGQEQEG